MSESTQSSDNSVTVVLPAKNEAVGLARVLPDIVARHPHYRIIVVDDGSTDETDSVCAQFAQVSVVKHRYSLGNGAAIKSGARAAQTGIVVFMDADGQHPPEHIEDLVERIEEGYDMAVGARQSQDQASLARTVANNFYNRLASWMTGYRIEDLTSGFRAARTRKFTRFLYLLPNKFSYPTTSTMAFFRSGYSIAYVPIRVDARVGKSHINLFRDGVRFFVIILKIGALFSPMRLFLPVSSALFVTGLCYYGYTYVTSARFTNMSALLFISAILTFLIGIVSEQISALHYKGTEEERE